ncbi:glycosyltransferase family 2 protein [Bacteroides mediterraneensis]|uniref:glycosyltransferase family 2 protein n=1 Tax=Bacteroides mediterraneensis TaxID=1841856 RepID=UPI0009348010|nr:glycosyltransferase family 2 protein [Bacteroides mediterraneensis]
MNPSISIIVPVYNAERTLNRCVDSILSQTFQEWELLLIDDGSTDRSGELCDEYVSKDQRIKVFHKKNGGVSSARNTGLNHAKGEWITFIDSDDEIPKNTFTDDCKYFTEDLIVGAYYEAKEDKEYHRWFLHAGVFYQNHLSEFYTKNISAPIFGVVWGKLFRNRLCKGLDFDTNMKVGEDTLFVMQYLQRVKELRVIDKDVYLYYMPNNFILKYSLDVKSSIYCLNRIYLSYQKLKVRSKDFERRIFGDYKLICQKHIYQNVSSWYKDERVKYIYNLIKDSFSLKYRITYALMSYSLFSKFLNFIRNINL